MNIFPWMGFTAGPISALVTAALVMGRTPPVDISGFSALPRRA
jgi:glycine/D-amino acid oxidase-like deaminating enzyme